MPLCSQDQAGSNLENRRPSERPPRGSNSKGGSSAAGGTGTRPATSTAPLQTSRPAISRVPADRFTEHARLRAAAMEIRDTRAEQGGVTGEDWQRTDELLHGSQCALHAAVRPQA
ncbi:MAG: hypothetical protein H6Q10_2308 [Acidobacteria bacterium]|nr:hypothetical protein [Acidobacteriota bacterium]